jgi:hypothetical protein
MICIAGSERSWGTMGAKVVGGVADGIVVEMLLTDPFH